MLLTVSLLVACVVVVIVALLLISPGEPRPVIDDAGRPVPGSLSEKLHVDINGMKQGMFIRSRYETNPVLLFVHGGPGMPTYFLDRPYPTGLEQYFTVVWWEQRGAGLSYSADLRPETITVEQLVSDTLEVTRYLRQRFGQEKIYLMGHSWGSFIGIQAAARAPELFHAYIGVAQVTYQLASEKLAYDFMLQEFRAEGNTRMARKLERAPVTATPPLPAAYMSLRDYAMHSLGIGTTREMKSVITGLFIPTFLSREYTLREKVNIWRGKVFSKRILWNDVLTTDVTRKVTRLELPVYFFHGTFDYTASYPLAKEFFERLDAPVKRFYTFEESAHSPLHEEPQRMRKIFEEDVLP